MDDLITSTDSVESAFQVYSRSKQIMKEAGLNLRKWKTNSSELVNRIEEVEASQDALTNEAISMIAEEKQSCAENSTSLLKPKMYGKLLGVKWDNQSDEFLVDPSELLDYVRCLPVTKRSVLKSSSRIFYPLGLVSPLVIRLKLLFRSLCTDNVDWDDPIEGDALTTWKSLVAEFGCIN